MEELTEWALEKELEQHTREQRESLIAIDEALVFDSANEELILMKEELMISVKAAEHSLFQLKRARLLQEVDVMAQAANVTVSSSGPGPVEALEEGASRPVPDEREAGREEEQTSSFSVGSRCRFRHTDGRWYNGKVFRLEEPDVAHVSFLTPTTEHMQICRFYLQQRCRFGGYCRQSHGVEVPLDALHLYFAPPWQNVRIGTVVLAHDTDEEFGLWRQAELESLDEVNQTASVVFIADGSRANVRYDNLALSEYAEMTDTSETSSEDDDGEDVDGNSHGIGLLSAGQQTDTVTFAKWEKHTRGVASKMMANMGFREGMGLGKSGQGQLVPIEVRILPPKQSLGYVDAKRKVNDGDGGNEMKTGTGVTKKKKSRGGKRKQQKKWAAAAFAAKVEQDRAPDVFGFINQQLAGQSGKGTRTSVESGAETYTSHKSRDRKPRKEDRQTILAHEDEMIEIRSKIVKLEEMATRNQKEKAVFDGVTRRLHEARKALKDAETAHAEATNAVQSKEKEKKWLRF